METKQLIKTTTHLKLALAGMFLGISMLAAVASFSRISPAQDDREGRRDLSDENEELILYEDESALYALEKLTPELRKQILEGAPEQTYNVLVILEEQADTRGVQGNYREVIRRKQNVAAKLDRDTDTNSIKNLIARAQQNGDITDLHWYTLVSGFSGKISFQTIISLNANSDIKIIDLYPIIEHAEEVADEATDGLAESQSAAKAFYGPETIKAPEAWEKGYTGKGIRVGIVDSDIYAEHPALLGKMDTIQSGPGTGELAFFDGYKISTPTYSANSHGTHVAGIVLGGEAKEGESNVDENKYIGVAPSSTYVFARSGFAPASLEWVANPDNDITTDDYPIVVNNSWINSLTAGLTYWIDALEDMGISVVFSAGNSGGAGPGSIKGLHRYPPLLLVGNSDEDGEINPGSSKGPAVYLGEEYIKPDVSAPGTNILSSVPKGGYINYKPNEGFESAIYKELSGTSMSAPMVTGAIALIQQAYFEKNTAYLSPGKIKSILQFTSVNVGFDNGKDMDAGAGIVDIISAIDLALNHATVYGTVKNAVGKGVPFVRISLVLNNLSYELYTDKYGQYEFALPAGTYSLQFSKKGHADKTIEFSVGADSLLDMESIILDNPSSFISYAPDHIDFFSAIGSEQTYEVEVYNHGSESLIVTGLESNNPHFVSKTNFPFSVPAYGETTLLLSFVPTQAAVESGNISFLSNAENPAAPIEVVGTGNDSNFVDVAAQAGIEQNHTIINPFKIGYARGVIWAQLNGDEWIDELVGEHDQDPMQYFIAFNTKGFFNIPPDYNGLKAAIFNENFIVRRVHTADMDNDGDQDIIADVANLSIVDTPKNQQLLILENNGLGYFSKKIIDEDVNSYSSFSIADIDKNGLLDIVDSGIYGGVPPYFAIKVFFQKEPWIFEEDTLVGGLSHTMDRLYFLDYDNDGFLDILGSSSFSSAEEKNGIFLFKNQSGSSFSFVKKIEVSGSSGGIHHLDIAFKDYDNDGDIDIYLQDRLPTLEKDFATDTILVNNTMQPYNGEIFFEMQSPYIPKTETHLGAGPITWTDYDNDGNPDIFFTYSKQGYNRLFRDLGNHKDYEERAALEGVQGTFNQYDSWDANAVWVDYDRDGDLDVHIPTAKWYHKLYKNSLYEKGGAHHWLQISLRGAESNRDAIGARVELRFVDGQVASDQILLTRQSGGQDPRIAHFGLGKKTASDIKELFVYWPSGSKKTYLINKIDRIITIPEDESFDEDGNFCAKYLVLKKGANTLCPQQQLEYIDGDQRLLMFVDHFDSQIMLVDKMESELDGLPASAEWALGKPAKYMLGDGNIYTFIYKGSKGTIADFEFNIIQPTVADCAETLKMKIGLNKICAGQKALYENGSIVFLIDMYKFNSQTGLVKIKTNKNMNMPVSDQWSKDKNIVYEAKNRRKYIFTYKGLSSDKKPMFDFLIK
ncbi:MAG: S8 family serine peptidase [Candidatus Magasanikbacteria bacterium]|nr:S8 family serine peptidase [Candidatus Magasanikbacteria bacterium]